jgi:hypothetical protein
MGMFDNIECKYPLPDIDLSDTDLTKELLQDGCNYQTKDLERTLTTYTLEEDGRISYVRYKNCKWIKDNSFLGGYMDYSDPETLYVSDQFLTSINFYEFFQFDDKSHDYWVEWQAVIKDSKVVEIKLFSMEKQDNAKRKQNSAKFELEMKKRREFISKWYYKYFLKYVLGFKRKTVNIAINLLSKLTRLLYKI